MQKEFSERPRLRGESIGRSKECSQRSGQDRQEPKDAECRNKK